MPKNAYAGQIQREVCRRVTEARDMEYSKAKLDGRLSQICGDCFQPWDVRYQR